MKLRNQLLLLSLTILSLPWAGCEYVREMERVMLNGQEREMLASARAVALMLAEQPEFFDNTDKHTTEGSIYFHKLPSAPQLDGYLDEWRNWPIDPVAMKPISRSRESSYTETETQAWVRSGFVDERLYLHIDVSDPSPTFSDPGIHTLESGDFLQIVRQDKPHINISVSSPGSILGRYINSEGKLVREFGVSGYWVDKGDGHQIELKINPSLLDGRIGLRYADKNIPAGRFLSELELGVEWQKTTEKWLSSANKGQTQPYLYAQANPELAKSIDFFTSTDLRLAISDRAGWLLAHGGKLQPVNWVNEENGLISLIYSLMLRSHSEPSIDHWQSDGRFNTLDVTSALLGEVRTASYSLNGTRVLRAVYPIKRAGEVLGAVIVEKSSAEVITATDSAFSRLLFWVLVVILVVIVSLIGYANLKTLSSKLSHELRTPLAIIRSSLDNLESEMTSEGRKTYAERASDGVSRLSAILNAMSGASRLEESTKNIETEKVDMAELLNFVTEGYRDAYPQSDFQLCIEENQEYKIDVAPELILQLLDKLVDNARDFCTKEGEILLGLSQTSQGAEKIFRLSVSNPGPLLPESMRTKLFDSLISVRSGNSETPHLGLGLHIVRLISEAHNAKVNAYNLTDQSGVCFQIDLPVN